MWNYDNVCYDSVKMSDHYNLTQVGLNFIYIKTQQHSNIYFQMSGALSLWPTEHKVSETVYSELCEWPKKYTLKVIFSVLWSTQTKLYSAHVVKEWKKR